jgi:hypothetical protein
LDTGTVIAVIAVVIAVAAIVVGVWAAFRSAWPRRTLYITVDSAVSMLHTAPGLDGGGIEVRHKGRKLSEPYVVTVTVASRSDRDIDSASFDNKPLELRFGVPIVELLESTVDARRAGVRTPPVVVTPTALHVGPALLTRRHLLRYVVLVDGQPQFRPVGDLVNAAIQEKYPPNRVRTVLVPILGLASGALSALLTNWLTSR